MQSIYIFSPALPDAAEAAVSRAASRTSSGGSQWTVQHSSGCALYVQIEPGCPADLEPDDVADVRELAAGIQSTIVVDVSRHGGGQVAAVEVALRLLEDVGGVAQDDNSDRLWTASEIRESTSSQDGFGRGYG